MAKLKLWVMTFATMPWEWDEWLWVTTEGTSATWQASNSFLRILNFKGGRNSIWHDLDMSSWHHTSKKWRYTSPLNMTYIIICIYIYIYGRSSRKIMSISMATSWEASGWRASPWGYPPLQCDRLSWLAHRRYSNVAGKSLRNGRWNIMCNYR